MPNNIDEHVVKMSFDNKQFESGVSQSLKTLDDLKKALNFDEVEGSLKNIENAFNNLNLSGLADSVDFIASRFEPLGKIADVALGRIADKALDAGKKITDAFFGFSDMSAGQSKYETRTKAVQTIMNATGKSIEEVEAVLDSLQKYTDETSYDFAAMVDNIGKFTSVGVDLEMAEKAMEGIGNEAAKSGASIQQANHAMYNFAQALSQGAVKLQDWRSISNATMATKEFKEMLISTAIEIGTLESAGENVGSLVSTNEKQLAAGEKALAKAQKATKDRAEKVAAAQEKIASATKKTEVNFQNFESTLSDGWLTSDVLIKTLNKYSDMNTDFGKEAYYAAQKALTFTDAIQATKDAVSSGWMDSFGYIFGNLEEAMELWTNVANALYEYVAIFADWRNEILKSWHEMGGYNDLIEAASNLWQTFMNIVKGVGEALTNVFPILKADNMTQALVDGTKKLKDWSADLLEMFGLYQEVTEEEEETAEQAEKIADKTNEITESANEAAKAVSGLSKETKKVASDLESVETGLKRGMRGENVKKLQKELMKFGFRLDKFGADGIFGPETQAALKALQREIGVAETGIMDEATKAALKTDEALRKLQEHANEGISIGARGEDIKKLQKNLNKYLGESDQLIVDGIFGPKTEAAIKKLQKELGIAQTGVFDQTTRNAIKTKKILLMNVKDLSKELKEGMKGADVKKLQQELIKGGYLDRGMADGIYGPKTKEAIKKLQKALGIKQTGEWDKATQIALHNSQQLTRAADTTAKANKKISQTSKQAAADNKKAAEEAANGTQKTTIAMKKLQAITRGFAAGIKIITKFAGSIVQIAKNIAGMFTPIVKDVRDFVYFISGMIENLSKQLDEDNAYKKFVDNVTSAFDPLRTFLNGIHTVFHDFLKGYELFLKGIDSKTPSKYNTFTNFLTYIKENYPVLNGIINVLKGAGKVIGTVINFISGILSSFFNTLSSEEFQNAKNSVFSWISDKISKIGEAITKFKEDHPELTIENFLNKIKEIGGWVGGKFGEGIDTIKNKFAEFKGVVDQFVKDHPELSISNIFQKIKDTFKGIGDVFSKFFSGGEQSEGGSFFDTLKERFKAFEPVLDWMEGIKDRIVKLWQSIFGLGEDVTAESGINKTVKAQITTFDGLQSKMSGIQSVVDWFVNLKDRLINAWNDLTNVGKTGGPDLVKEGGFTSVFDRLGEFSKEIAKIDLGKVISTALKAMAVYSVLNISNGIKNFGKGAKTFGKDIGKMVESLTKPFTAIANKVAQNFDFKGLSKALSERVKYGKQEKESIGTKALKLAGSLLMVVAAIAIVTKVVKDNNQNDMDKALWIIGGILVALGTISILVAAFSKEKATNSKGSMTGILALCGGIYVIVLAIGRVIGIITGTNQKVLEKALWIVGGALVILGAISVLIAAFSKGETSGVKGILSLCAGVYVLVLALEKTIKVIKDIPVETLNNALVIVGGMLVLLGIFAVLISATSKDKTSGVKGLLSMCAGIYVLVLALEKTVQLVTNTKNKEDLWSAVGIVGGMIVLLGAIAVLVAALSKQPKVKVSIFKSLVGAVAVLVGLMAVVVGMIAQYNAGVVWQAFAMIAILVGGLGAIAILMGRKETDKWTNLSSAAVFLSMAFMIEKIVSTIGDVIYKIKDVNPEVLKWFFIGIDGAIAIMATTVAVLGKLFASNPIGLIIGEAGLLALLGVLAAGIDVLAKVGESALKRFSSAMKYIGWGMESFNNSTGAIDLDRLKKVGEFLKDNLPNLVKSVLGIITDGLNDKTAAIKDMGTKIHGFAIAVSKVDQKALDGADKSKKLMEKADEIADVLIEASIPDLGKIGSLYMFGTGLYAYGYALSQMKAGDEATVANVVSQTNSLLGIVTDKGKLDQATESIQALGGALEVYFQALETRKINENGQAVENTPIDIQSMAQKMRELVGAFTDDEIGELTSYGEGKQHDMSAVANGIAQLSLAFKSYGENIGAIKKEEVERANGIIDKVQGMTYDQTKMDGFYTSFSGISIPGAFIVALEIFGLGLALSSYAENIGKLKPKQVENANDVLNEIMKIYELKQKLTTPANILDLLWKAFHSNSNEFNITQFTTDVIAVGEALEAYAGGISELTLGKVLIANSVLEKLMKVANGLPQQDWWTRLLFGQDSSLGNFGDNAGKLGGGLRDFGNAISGANFDTSKIDAVLKDGGVVQRLLGFMGDVNALVDLAKLMGGNRDWSYFASGFSNLATELVNFQTNLGDSFDITKIEGGLSALERIVGMFKGLNYENLYAADDLPGVVTAFLGDVKRAFTKVEGEESSIDGLASIGQSIVDSLATGVTNAKIDGLNTAIFNAIDTSTFYASISMVSAMNTLGTDILSWIETGLKDESATTKITGSIESLIGKIKTVFTSSWNTFKGMGTFINLGIATGLNESQSNVIQMAENVAWAAYLAAKKKLGIQSPSREFMWIGEMANAGLAKGFRENLSVVSKAATGVQDSLINAFEDIKERTLEAARNGGKKSGMSEFLKTLLFGHGSKRVMYDIVEQSITGQIDPGQLVRKAVKDSGDAIDDSISMIGDFIKMGVEGIKNSGIPDAITTIIAGDKKFNYLKNAITQIAKEAQPIVASLFEDDFFTANYSEMSNWYKILYDNITVMSKDIDDYEVHRTLGDILANQLDTGNVDALNRNILTGADMLAAGWEEFKDSVEEIVTYYSGGYSGIVGNVPYALTATPIDANGNVLSPSEFDNYVYDLIDQSANIDELMKNDMPANGGKGLVLHYTPVVDENWDGAEEAEALYGQLLHTLDAAFEQGRLSEYGGKNTAVSDYLIELLKTGIKDPSITDVMGDEIKTVLDALIANNPEIKNSIGTGLFNAFNNDPLIMSKPVVSVAENAAEYGLDKIKGAFEKTGAASMLSLILGVVQKEQEVRDKVEGVINGAEDKALESKDKFKEVGLWLAQGLAQGIRDNVSIVTRMAEQVALSAFNAAKAVLGIASPSTEFMWIGEMLDAGLAKGLETYGQTVRNAAGNVASGAVDTATRGVLALNDVLGFDGDYQPVIRPVLDLSNIQANAGAINDLLTPRSITPVRSAALASNIAATHRSRQTNDQNVPASNNGDLSNIVDKFNEKMDEMTEEIKNLKIYMDGTTLVGYVSPRVNRTLGHQATLAGRMN